MSDPSRIRIAASLAAKLSRVFAVTLLACLVSAVQAPAQTPAATQQVPTLTVKPLNGGVYWIEGDVGNTGFIVGQNGVILIDAKRTDALAKAVQAEVVKVTTKPITHIILTHSDGDHVNGLGGYPAGLTVIAHENNRKEMEASLNNPLRQPGGSSVITVPRDRLPNKLIREDEEMTIEGVRLKLLHKGSAHTSGDLMIYLPDQSIVFTGDIVVTFLDHDYPDALIKQDKSGVSQGWIDSIKMMIALNARTYVPGHGSFVQTRDDLERRVALVEEKRTKIRAMAAQHKSLDEIKAALGESERRDRFPTFTEVVYNEVTKGG